MSNIIILIIVIICVALILAIIGARLYKSKGWSCVEGTCEFVIGGKYSSENKCKDTCKDKII